MYQYRISYDKEVVKKFIDDIAKDVNKNPINAAVSSTAEKLAWLNIELERN